MESTEKVALITGAARRVGRAIALTLADAGFHIAVHYRHSDTEARDLARNIEKRGRRVALIQGDLADTREAEGIVPKVVDQLGRVDVLINSASVFEKTPLAHADAATWEQTFRVNLFAPALLIRSAAPAMRRVGGGRVINLTDISADRPVRDYAPYCASKAALANLTRSLASELAPEITVNAIAPGIAVFPEHYTAEVREQLTARVPLQRAGTPEELAALVRFLITEGHYITGQTIAFDGGRSITLS